MAKRSTLDRIGAMFAAIGSAAAVAGAMEAGRAPRARDLVALGIEPQAFGKIGRR